MSTNFIQPGDVMEFTAPTGGVTKGVPVLIGGLFVIPVDTALVSVAFRGKVNGVWTLPKTITEGALVEGMPAFWDVANAAVSILPNVGHLPIGMIAVAALTSDTTCIVRLNGASLSGRMLTIRKRIAVASVTAGATLLPAIPGAKYRLVDGFAIAVGGAVGAVTTVDLIGTLSTARKLIAFGQAALTQSALVRAGASGGVILADGASFTANDAGAAVTVGVTGSAITVATSIDFTVNYSIE